MVKIQIKQGLDIPIAAQPIGLVQVLPRPTQIAWNFDAFDEVNFKLLVKAGDTVKIGQPLAEDKQCPGRYFVSYAAGVVKEIRRGEKRRLRAIVIDVGSSDAAEVFSPIDLNSASKEHLISQLKRAGFFTAIRSRPFNLLANPEKSPRSIFVKGLESAPYAPSMELQLEGLEREFQAGLETLSKMTDGTVHLVYRHDSKFQAFNEAKHVEKHTVEGPHPASNVSVHIHHIDPIKKAEDVVWTVHAFDVAAIGRFVLTGTLLTEKIISIAGSGVLPGRTGFFKVHFGYPIGGLIAGRVSKGWLRFISGDPLTGEKVGLEDFLGFIHNTFCVIPEGSEREFLHFFRLGMDRYTASGAYLSGHLNSHKREWEFTTNQHGEHRFFVDGSVYQNVMPMRIPTMQLVRAVMAEDYDLAEELGLLEVDPEDFALPEFICPSKMELTSIIRTGLRFYAKEMLQ